MAPWQRQLILLRDQFNDAAKEGFFVRVTLASIDQKQGDKAFNLREHESRHQSFVKRAIDDQ